VWEPKHSLIHAPCPASTPTLCTHNVWGSKHSLIHAPCPIATPTLCTHKVWEPKLDVEEDLDRVRVVRKVPNVTVLLSLIPLDPHAPGYQPPLPESEVTPDGKDDD
jgi:hypothetical protein